MIIIASIGCLVLGFSIGYYISTNGFYEELKALNDKRISEYKEAFEKGYEAKNGEKPFEEPVKDVEPAVISMEELMNMLSEDEKREESGLVYQERKGSIYE